jgi:hypothetical protein
MRFRPVACMFVVGVGITSQALAVPDCSVRSVPTPLPLRPTALPPLSGELPSGSHQLGTPDGVLAYQSDEMQAVDRVLMRLREEACRPARATSAGAAYVPKTKWDNSPYRFSAGGDGKKFTAADFDAWMKANGIHISKGAPQPAPATQPQPSQQPPIQQEPNPQQ